MFGHGKKLTYLFRTFIKGMFSVNLVIKTQLIDIIHKQKGIELLGEALKRRCRVGA